MVCPGLLFSPGSLPGLTILSLLLKVLQASLGISLHGLSTLLPSGRAHLAVLVGELEGLDQADRLLDVAADGEVVDGDLAENTLGVDDEEAAERDALVLDEDAVAARDLGGLVGDEGELQVGAQTALLAGLLNPREMGEVGVGGHAENGGVDLAEAVEGVVVLDDLGRADEGEVHGVEEKNNPTKHQSVCPSIQVLRGGGSVKSYHCPLKSESLMSLNSPPGKRVVAEKSGAGR